MLLPTGFGKSICYECVTSCVSNNGSHRRVNTAPTLQVVYLVWLFLRITTTCNLSIIGLVRKRFPESFAHAQTVDTRPLFPPPMWPGYEASLGACSPRKFLDIRCSEVASEVILGLKPSHTSYTWLAEYCIRF